MSITPDTTPVLADDPAELDRFLTEYRPSRLPERQWLAVAPDAVALVKSAGPLTRARVEKDIQTLGAVATRLVERSRPLTLEEALSDRTMLDFDLALGRDGASDKTRENRRGILRRLQAVHRDVPWRRERRSAGERISRLAPASLAEELSHLVELAEAADSPAAVAFLTEVTAARGCRLGASDARTETTPETWTQARRFAEDRGVRLTRTVLSAAVTHEVLLEAQPLAVLIPTAGLTRRDLDLGLTHVAPTSALSDEQRNALRGV